MRFASASYHDTTSRFLSSRIKLFLHSRRFSSGSYTGT
jgi:hypothetical protein